MELPAVVEVINGEQVVKQEATIVGCGHWTAEELAPFGWYPVEGAADPRTETESGYTFDAAAQVYRPEITPRPAGEVRSACKGQIDRLAGQARTAFITDAPGQDLIYEAKRSEVVKFDGIIAGGGQPNPADYPWMSDRAERLGLPLSAVAAEWRARNAAWVQVGVAIERVRETAKEKLAQAVTASQAWAVVTEAEGGFAAIIEASQ
jgi:hypothetical protein